MKIKWCAVILLVGILLLSAVACGGGTRAYQLRISVDGQGSVTPKSGAFPIGATVMLTAIPKQSWLFDHWEGDVSGSQNPTTITMDSKKAVTAYFLKYDYFGSDLRINTKALPAWIEGTYGAFTLDATGGTGAKSWRGTPPSPWVLDPSGVISGTPPLLEGFFSRTYPPFTVTVIDEARHAREAMYTIEVINAPPQLTPKTISVIWDENKPPKLGYIELATISGGVPSYRMAFTSGFPPSGMRVGIGPDGVSVILKGPPTARGGTYTFRISIADSKFFEASADVKLEIIEAKPLTEVFKGTFSGPFGTTSASTGCQWSHSLSGTMTLTLVPNSDGTISGTANVPTDDRIVVTRSSPYGSCTFTPFSLTATGTVSGTNASFSGSFTGPSPQYPQYPLKIVFTGARSGNTITGSITVSKTFHITVEGVVESTPTLSTTISNIVLTKQQ